MASPIRENYSAESGDYKRCRTCTDFQTWAQMQRKTYNTKTDSVNLGTPSREDCPLDSSQLGRSTWGLLHTMAAYYPELPTSQQEDDVRNFFSTLSRLYPCSYCAEDFQKERKCGSAMTKVIRIILALLFLYNGIKYCAATQNCTGIAMLTTPALKVDVTGCSLQEIPSELPDGVRVLEASHNNITTIRNEVFVRAGSPQLKTINLSYNFITIVEPGAFLGLQALIFLNLAWNKITRIHHETFIENLHLEDLNLAGNPLDLSSTKPFLDASFKKLDISSCRLLSVPIITFNKLKKLEELIVSNNSIRTLESGVFISVPQLKYLYMLNNSLSSLNSDVLSPLKNLKILDLSNNYLTVLETNLFENQGKLERLYLSNNRLKVLGTGLLKYLKNLKLLDAHRNEITVLYNDSFAELKNVTDLNLSENRLRNLNVQALCPLTSLKHFSLQDNPLMCDCKLFEVWTWNIHHGIKLLATCDSSDGSDGSESLLLQQLEKLRCIVTELCVHEIVTSAPNDSLSLASVPWYFYVIISVAFLLGVMITLAIVIFCYIKYKGRSNLEQSKSRIDLCEIVPQEDRHRQISQLTLQRAHQLKGFPSQQLYSSNSNVPGVFTPDGVDGYNSSSSENKNPSYVESEVVPMLRYPMKSRPDGASMTSLSPQRSEYSVTSTLPVGYQLAQPPGGNAIRYPPRSVSPEGAVMPIRQHSVPPALNSPSKRSSLYLEENDRPISHFSPGVSPVSAKTFMAHSVPSGMHRSSVHTSTPK